MRSLAASLSAALILVACGQSSSDICGDLVVDRDTDSCQCPEGTEPGDDVWTCVLPDGGTIRDPNAPDASRDSGLDETDAGMAVCEDGATEICEGDSEGACDPGRRTCERGRWSACEGAVTPTPETCNGADDDCDGTRDGAPANAQCARAPRVGDAVCSAGSCIITECDSGYSDCDADSGTGCEAELAADTQNCGECGVVCEFGETCVEGECAPRNTVAWAIEITASQLTAWDLVAVPGGVGFVATVGGASIRVNGATVANGSLGASSGSDSLVGVVNDDGTVRWVKRVGSLTTDGFSVAAATETALVAGGFVTGTGDYYDGRFACASPSCSYLYGPATVIVGFDLATGALEFATRRASEGAPTAISVNTSTNTACVSTSGTWVEMVQLASVSGRVDNDRSGSAWRRELSGATATSSTAIDGNCTFTFAFEDAVDFGSGSIEAVGVDASTASFGATGALGFFEHVSGERGQVFYRALPTTLLATESAVDLAGVSVMGPSLQAQRRGLGSVQWTTEIRYGTRLAHVSAASGGAWDLVAITPTGDVVVHDQTIPMALGDATMVWLSSSDGSPLAYESWRSSSAGSLVAAKVAVRGDSSFSASLVTGTATFDRRSWGAVGGRVLVLARHVLR